MPGPPVLHASSTGGIDVTTAATPPRATNPTVPIENSPAYPHWMFTPRAIIADNKHKFKRPNATFQLWLNPTMIKNKKIIPKSEMFL